jgi:hypothetical protein
MRRKLWVHSPIILLLLLLLIILSYVCCIEITNERTTPRVNTIRYPLPGNGILNPPLRHQRYRLQEYDRHHAYYQWWYYYIQDFKANRHYAFAYGMTTCRESSPKENCQYDLTYVMFAMIDNNQTVRFQKYEVYPLANWQVTEEFHVRLYNTTVEQALLSGMHPLFELYPLDNNRYHLTGHMVHDSKNVWLSENIDPNAEIVWDITLERVYGYYAQDIFEIPDEWFKGVIMWNTYAHNSLVHNGKISINGNIQYLDHNNDPTKVRFRAYGDGNWGQLMPDDKRHPEDKNYAWGWYLTHIPNNNPSKDVSVIAGTGKTYTAFPFYTMEGKFADVRINSSLHIEFREVVVYGQKLISCNDGKLLQFNVERTNWTTISDSFGSATIPMNQLTILESDNWLIRQDCRTVYGSYNRLLFPFKSSIFSDFEGLGVNCRLTIKYKVTQQVLIDQDGIQSGIEYGFHYDIHNIPPIPWKRK